MADEDWYYDDEEDEEPEEESDDWVAKRFARDAPLSVAERKAEQRRIDALRRHEEARVRHNLLEVRPVGEWMRASRRGRAAGSLFGDLWRENELSILFADTGVGKSMLAVQIADSIVRGGRVDPFEMTVKPQPVLYLDFEMTHEQFSRRYSRPAADGRRFSGSHRFPRAILRGEIDWNMGLPERFRTYGEFVHISIEDQLREHDVRVLIIDNISWLVGGGFGSESAIHLMKGLKQLKNDNYLSILVLAHTLKRSEVSPLAIDDLAGSKMLSNFADNVFAIGRSGFDADIRYIKQLKQRNAPILHDSSNVVVFRIEASRAFPRFEFVRYGTESQFLGRPNDDSLSKDPKTLTRPELIETVSRLHSTGLSHRRIAARLGLSKTTVTRLLSSPRCLGAESAAAADRAAALQ